MTPGGTPEAVRMTTSLEQFSRRAALLPGNVLYADAGGVLQRSQKRESKHGQKGLSASGSTQ